MDQVGLWHNVEYIQTTGGAILLQSSEQAWFRDDEVDSIQVVKDLVWMHTGYEFWFPHLGPDQIREGFLVGWGAGLGDLRLRGILLGKD